jgi:hypothetical protein
MISQSRIVNDVEEIGHGLIYGTILAFAWSDWGKLRKTSQDRWSQAEIWTRDLHSTTTFGESILHYYRKWMNLLSQSKLKRKKIPQQHCAPGTRFTILKKQNINVDQMGTAGPASLLYCSPHDVHRQNTYLLLRSSYLLTLHEYCTLKTHRLLICRSSDRC